MVSNEVVGDLMVVIYTGCSRSRGNETIERVLYQGLRDSKYFVVICCN